MDSCLIQKLMKVLITGVWSLLAVGGAERFSARKITAVIAEWNFDAQIRERLPREFGERVSFLPCDVAEYSDVARVFRLHPDISHAIHLAYLMSAEVEANPHLGGRVNVLGMVNMFEAAVNQRLQRLVFTSSETVDGMFEKVYGDRPVTESDFCAPSDITFSLTAS